MVDSDLFLKRRGFGQTARPDAWWIQSLLVFLGFSAFIVYATWAAFQGSHYTWGPYLSPFYSPEILAHLDIAGSAPNPIGGLAGFPGRRLC
jgi:hypothetical protein